MAFYNRVTALAYKGRVADVIYLESCKTFDTVPDDILVSNLKRHGFNGWITQYIENWLDCVTQNVAVNNPM